MISPGLLRSLLRESRPVPGVNGLFQIGEATGLESTESLAFALELASATRASWRRVLRQRALDREFIDQRVRACAELNRTLRIPFTDADYETVLGQEDGQGRIVWGPRDPHYCRATRGTPVAPLPPHLVGCQVTLFAPPGDAAAVELASRSMELRLPGEPAIVETLVAKASKPAKWGADAEDSVTPRRRTLAEGALRLSKGYNGGLQPVKRLPGLAVPCTFLFDQEEPLPLHVYELAIHLWRHWDNPAALSFYFPKLENEEEAAYLRELLAEAERRLQQLHPAYTLGTIRVIPVIENPRAIFRVQEILEALRPYFAGASLGWHDFLAATARLFKEDPHYRVPVKADPAIVVERIRASHELLSQVVGARGGIKIGGMYGVLPVDEDPRSASFQITLQGFLRDTITQLRRGLDGYWVAEPRFVRLGIAVAEGWREHQAGNPEPLRELTQSLLLATYQKPVLELLEKGDVRGLDRDDPLYPRSLIAADLGVSSRIANHDPEEVRYNVFQTLQYLASWLAGQANVALPAQINGVPVRVLDDLATAERSRWEVWAELRHGRFEIEDFIRILHEEMLFIRKDRSDGRKIVQVKWDADTARWYPIAQRLVLQLMTSPEPPESALELLLPFTVESIRAAEDPWQAAQAADPQLGRLPHYTERFEMLFHACGSVRFARALAGDLELDLNRVREVIFDFSLQDILDAASFHGDIGESAKSLDATASREQALVQQDRDEVKARLRELGAEYLRKFGFKYLISAQGRGPEDIRQNLESRLQNTGAQELQNAREALWQITSKRLQPKVERGLWPRLEQARLRTGVTGAQISVSAGSDAVQTLCFGEAIRGGAPVELDTWFELASLSKTLGSAFAIEYFRRRGIPLETSVNTLLAQSGSSFRLSSDAVELRHLMNHQALNLHYVNGVPLGRPMPPASAFLNGNDEYGYEPIRVQHEPGTAFQYSGGGFLVLEHLIESFEGKPIQFVTAPFFRELGIADLSFEQGTIPTVQYAHGYLDHGDEVAGTRKMFPAFAAGAMGTAAAYHRFLSRLGDAFHSLSGASGISHDTAVQMLWDKDRASQPFMGVNIGLGVFVAEAGANRLAIHQGANDGFRCLSLHCFSGPDRGKGFVIFCNADNRGVGFVAEAAQLLLTELGFSGVDTSKFGSEFDPSRIPQEEIVNRGYKELVFSAFQPDLPEPILDKGPPDPLAPYNLAVGARILEVSDQGFARAENLLSPHLPKFNPELYERQGKVMDSWETVRHNAKPADDPHDSMLIELVRPAAISFVSLSTQYHFGNHSPFVQLEAWDADRDGWFTLLEKTPLEGHSIRKIRLEPPAREYRRVRVRMYPDGGLSRLGLFDASLPESEQASFLPLSQSQCVRVAEAIPHPKKPLAPKYAVTPERIQANWARITPGFEVNLASLALGARILRATNEHYGPAVQVISPYPPLHMFDGAESARSRDPGHREEVEIALARTAPIHRIEVDFDYFRNNNPVALQIEGRDSAGDWKPLVLRTPVKAYAGNRIRFDLADAPTLSEIRITVFPDGGFNRVRVFGKA